MMIKVIFETMVPRLQASNFWSVIVDFVAEIMTVAVVIFLNKIERDRDKDLFYGCGKLHLWQLVSYFIQYNHLYCALLFLS